MLDRTLRTVFVLAMLTTIALLLIAALQSFGVGLDPAAKGKDAPIAGLVDVPMKGKG